MSRQPIRGVIKREKEVSVKQKYLEAHERYLNGEFTYDTHCLIQNLTQKGKRQPHMEGVPLYKTLIQIAKILMLNELEILFLGATLQQMKWKIIDNCLNAYIDDFKGIADHLKSDTYNKKIQLSLLLIGNVVKVYLNQAEEATTYQYPIKQIVVKNYDKMYREWVQKMKKNFKFSPKYVNKLFKQMDIIKTKKQSELDDVNYNSKVEQLFKIYVEQDQKNDHVKEQEEPDYTPVEQQESVPQNVIITNMARTQSIQSLRSFGRRESQRSDQQFIGYGLRNLSSIFRNNSLDDQ